MTTKPQKLTVNPLVTAQQTASGSVLVDVATGDCYELNAVGAEIWVRLARGEDEATIVPALSAEYGVSTEVAAGDVRTLITDLTRNGLLVSASS